MRVGLVGSGLQGCRRAPIICAARDQLVVVSADPKEPMQAGDLAKTCACEATVGWEQVVKRDDLDAVVICTPPHLHAKIAIAAMESCKHVLCEKPLATSLSDGQAMVDAAKNNKVKLKCGLNHRFHPAIAKAKQLFDAGEIGEAQFVRCRYGIGARPNCGKEWRADPTMAGGGELMDQGTHAIDLSRWFLGDFSEVAAFTANYIPDLKKVEDNGFLLLKTTSGRIASIHASLSQWKNLFSFEVFGSEGYLTVEGLGGSYGTERLVFGKKDCSKPFTEEVTEFRGEDHSWLLEWQDFTAAIRENREPLANGVDGLRVLQLVNAAYDSAHKHCIIQLSS
ncbi:MAG: Gfo/Idh/MocA family oxidoreductase [Candidatus Bathyarchaeota archaeon]|nr:Gfo/Idh/MocA family oxidoreductase [Candidatus Bathyarchaeota archaeon]